MVVVVKNVCVKVAVSDGLLMVAVVVIEGLVNVNVVLMGEAKT